MATALNETYFEQYIANQLAESPLYVQRTPHDFDIESMIDRDMFASFLKAQTVTWNKLTRVNAGKSDQQIVDLVVREYLKFLTKVDIRGNRVNSILDVLTKGFTVMGAKIKFLQPKPLTEGMNDDNYRLYLANRFAIVRQFRYSNNPMDCKNEIDLAILCNGVPVFTLELKNENTGQDFQDSITQYRTDRDPNNKLLQSFLVHFAMDTQLVFMTTKLNGEKTRFLPFNRGTKNEPIEGTYPTAYMWQDILQADSLIDIITNFIKCVRNDDNSIDSVIFPRFHQLRCVKMLRDECYKNGAGHDYLIEHSAGSGKTKTMTWLAEQLTNLTKNGNPVYDTVVMVTDRIVLNGNMADEVNALISTKGLVKDIRRGAKNLASAIDDGYRIIVSTVQKYAFALNTLKRDQHRRYAIIVDEAHTAIGNEAAKALTKALSTDEDLQNLTDFHPEECESELDALMMYQQAVRQKMQHLSYFAFTATPKDKTYALYGKNGKEAHDYYTMKQAIEEGFILDVLKYYVSYQTLFQYEGNNELPIDNMDKYEKKKALALIYGELNKEQYIMLRKAVLMVEHFTNYTINKIGKRAKAMIVADSRQSAVRYKLMIDRILQQQQLDNQIKTLVAFSDSVEYNGVMYSESSMNDEHVSDDKIRKLFEKDEYKILIVANKFQTGFDQPLLHTMYVDKSLAGIQSIQTLSRLNRCCPEKEDTLVMDFRNNADDVQRDFQRYYTITTLDGDVDIQRVYGLKEDVERYELFTQSEVDLICQHMVSGTVEAIPSIIISIVDRAKEYLDDERIDIFRKNVKRYIRQYGFLAQLMQFTDPDLEKLDIFCRILYKYLPYTKETLPYEILDKIDLSKLRIQKAYEGQITLDDEDQLLKSPRIGDVKLRTPDEKLTIFEILDLVNEPYLGVLNEHDNIIRQVFEELMADTDISESFNAGNTYDVLMNIVSEKMGRKLTEQIGRYYNFLEILEHDNGLKMSLIQHFVNAIAQRTRAIQDFPYDPTLLKERLYDKFSEDFLVLHRYGLRPLREVLDAFFQILRTTSISSLDGINDLLRDTINRYMMDEHMRLIDKRLTYNTLSSKFEAYLKKLYYLIHGEQVTTREGTTHNAQFLDAAKSFKCLRDLYYSDQPELQEFKRYYADIHNWRNVEAHNAPELSETQIDSRVYELLAMYLFVTLYSIGDLEYAGVL